MTTFTGTSGNDTLSGTSTDDFFNMNDGGTDTVSGNAGNDIVTFSGTFTSADRVNGGTGYDSILLNGNYSAGVTLGSTTISNVEEIDMLGSTNSYKLITNNANVASGQTLVVSAASLDSAHTLYFDSTSDIDAFFKVTSGAGNDTIKVRAGGDTINSGAGNDSITLQGSLGGSHDTISAGAGIDTINAGIMLKNGEVIDGGADFDTVVISGDYSVQLSFSATTLTNVEKLILTTGNSYYLREDDGNLSAGQSLFVDGSSLGVNDKLSWLGFAETNGSYHVEGGAGFDTIYGSSGIDTLNGNAGDDIINGEGGADSINGGTGNDTIYVLGSLTAASSINGGGGFSDHLYLNGDYSAGVIFTATTMVDFDYLTLGGPYNYNLTLNDGNVGAGQALSIDDFGMTAANTVKINGAAETNGSINITINGPETLNLTTGGGFDHINIAGQFSAANKINGGSAADFVTLYGGAAGPLVFAAATIQNVAQLSFAGDFSYNVKLNDGNVAAGATLYIYDSSAQMTAADTLTLDGSAESNGSLIFDMSGPDTHVLTGGIMADSFKMHGSLHASDAIDGGAGVNYMELNGDYSAGLTLAANTFKNIASLQIDGGHNYSLTENDGNVAAGATLAIEEGGNLAGDVVIFNGSAETDGSFKFSGGLSSDILTGGAQNDSFGSGMGNDMLNGGGGDDNFFFGTGEFTAADKIDGGAGTDTLTLNGDYSAVSLVFGSATMQNVESVILQNSNFNIVTNDSTVAAGASLYVTGPTGSNALTFDASAETDGNFIIQSGDGDDSITTGADADFVTEYAGHDIVHSGAGNDTILFLLSGKFDATDVVDGGAGNDTLELQGDTGGVVLNATSVTNVETILLDNGHVYSLTMNDANVAAGATLTVDGTGLILGGATVTIDGSAELDGAFVLKGGSNSDSLTGGAGNDTVNGGGGTGNTLSGGDGNDTISIYQDASDTVIGGNGDDKISAGGAFSAFVSIDGGAGNDTLLLNGDYGGGVTFLATTMQNVETIGLSKGHNYNLTVVDANVAAGQALTISGTNLLAGDSLIFNGSSETNGAFFILGGAGNDTLTGGAGKDGFNLTKGGIDTASGGAGSDTFNFGATFSAADQIDGGAGTGDVIRLDGDYSAGVVFSATTLVNVETILLAAGNSYALTTDDATIATGQKLTVDGSLLSAGQSLNFTGSAEADGGLFVLIGGAGNDTLKGGNAADKLTGGLGADSLKGGTGADVFIYNGVAESTGSAYDTLVSWSSAADKFDLDVTVTGIDAAVAAGSLSAASFDTDLASDLGASKLLAGHAVLFTASAGTLSGHTFLVVDANGTAGYQADQDYVFDVTGGGFGALSTATFI